MKWCNLERDVKAEWPETRAGCKCVHLFTCVAGAVSKREGRDCSAPSGNRSVVLEFSLLLADYECHFT